MLPLILFTVYDPNLTANKEGELRGKELKSAEDGSQGKGKKNFDHKGAREKYLEQQKGKSLPCCINQSSVET